MPPEQAIAILTGLLNSPVARLALSIQELSACELAVRTLADASQPKPENVVPMPPPGESPAQP